jgi:hypothetical protein
VPKVDPRINTWSSGDEQVFDGAEMRHPKILGGAKMRHGQSKTNYRS